MRACSVQPASSSASAKTPSRGIEPAAGDESLVVGSLGELQYRRGTPSGLNSGRSEGVADDVAQQNRLSNSLE
jgi:hypothetical protein